VEKIVNALVVDSEEGHRVIEIGPGSGAITRVLHKKYPRMTAIEIDQRAVKFLSEKIPELNCLHLNVLNADWGTLATERCGKLNILGNLPYYITSQVLFTLADHYTAINQAVVTMQLEVCIRVD
jgi:16S rRNA (adenine1518-N6/adenine1519-N6)-dimethyltransferase